VSTIEADGCKEMIRWMASRIERIPEAEGEMQQSVFGNWQLIAGDCFSNR